MGPVHFFWGGGGHTHFRPVLPKSLSACTILLPTCLKWPVLLYQYWGRGIFWSYTLTHKLFWPEKKGPAWNFARILPKFCTIARIVPELLHWSLFIYLFFASNLIYAHGGAYTPILQHVLPWKHFSAWMNTMMCCQYYWYHAAHCHMEVVFHNTRKLICNGNEINQRKSHEMKLNMTTETVSFFYCCQFAMPLANSTFISFI